MKFSVLVSGTFIEKRMFEQRHHRQGSDPVETEGEISRVQETASAKALRQIRARHNHEITRSPFGLNKVKETRQKMDLKR